MKRTRVSLSVAALMAGLTLSACGGAPTDASVKEFCDAQNSLFENLLDNESEPSEKELAQEFNDWADRMEEVGTPEDIPEDARKGFELTVDELGDVDEEDMKNDMEELEKRGDDFSDEEKDQVDAYDAYVSETCGEPELETPDMPELETPAPEGDN